LGELVVNNFCSFTPHILVTADLPFFYHHPTWFN